MRIKDLQIGAQLMGGFILVLVLAAAQALYAIYGARSLNDNARQMTERWLPATQHAGELHAQVNLLRAAQFQHVLTFSEDERRALEKQMEAMRKDIDQEMQSLAPFFTEGTQQQTLAALQEAWKQYKTQQEEIVSLARQRRDEEALDILKGPALKTFGSLTTEVGKLGEQAKLGADEAHAQNGAVRDRVLYGNLGSLLLTSVLGLLIGHALSRRISGGARHAAQLALRVAQGDLSAPIQPNTRDEFGQLLQALLEMQTALTNLVARVRAGSEAVSMASAEIAEGNQDLSARTEAQASSLEQTAASMEQLGSTVKQNAANAVQANQYAQEASAVAAQGGEVVSQVVETMKGISEASKKIADIISVIDGIAFQTNILALNAAVEAARAGEQGRGFAVVAGEVRALAGRSADAAKEIKNLITASVVKVEQGASLVDQAGSTMGKVVDSIRRVTEIMGEISAASAEQSDGVAQVEEAITNMDKTTQQNAALVEEMAAATNSMKTQAQALVRTVGVFRLKDGTPVPMALAGPDGSPDSVETDATRLPLTDMPQLPMSGTP
ncbi:methyl-accepting chemotaxis protein [Hylemonella sp. W303a]|uniref:methyl-accepting chemotaxis protein n=1 Tax=Hylemonella sp. W303a TaxID=3389873 RepID=UPI00396B44A3